MAAGARPVAGAPIETTWGQQVHDVAQGLLGVVCTAAAYASNTQAALDLNAIVEGKASMVDLAANRFIAPQAGIYETHIGGNFSGYTGGWYRLDLQKNGVSIGGGGWWPAITATAQRFVPMVHMMKLAAGDYLQVIATPPIGGSGTQTITCDYLAFRLLAQDYAA